MSEVSSVKNVRETRSMCSSSSTGNKEKEKQVKVKSYESKRRKEERRRIEERGTIGEREEEEKEWYLRVFATMISQIGLGA